MIVDDVKAALRAFLASVEKGKGSDYIRSVIVQKLGPKLEPDLRNELVQLATLEALEAKSPPWTVGGIPGWVARVTRRQIAHYFRARKDDEDNLDPRAEPSDTFDRHAPQTDWGAREHLIAQWLDEAIGPDPRRRETFKLILDHEIAGKTLGELAAEYHTTESALSNRFHKLRRQLVPKAALMDQEKPRRAVLLALFVFGLGALVALVTWLLRLWLPVSPPIPVVPEPIPTLSAAPSPSFDQAFPTPSSAPANDAGERKPQERKP